MKFTKNQIILISLLGFLTVLATTQYFEIGMMGLSGFVLAYLGKGLRKPKPPSPDKL
jgi:hypothetical protein